MSPKKTRGFTLVELTVSIALLTLLTAGIGYIMYAAFQTYNANQRLLEDELNARNALLFITRQTHSGAHVVANTETDVTGNTRLTLKETDEDNSVITEIMFYLDSTNTLKREIKAGSTLLPFREVQLDEFKAELSDDEKRLGLAIKCRNGLELETKVSLSRTQ